VTYRKKLIEVTLPPEAISAASAVHTDGTPPVVPVLRC
jgi:hypothetical protein